MYPGPARRTRNCPASPHRLGLGLGPDRTRLEYTYVRGSRRQKQGKTVEYSGTLYVCVWWYRCPAYDTNVGDKAAGSSGTCVCLETSSERPTWCAPVGRLPRDVKKRDSWAAFRPPATVNKEKYPPSCPLVHSFLSFHCSLFLVDELCDQTPVD